VRAPRRSRLRGESGASVATTIMIEPSPRPAAEGASRSSRPTGTPAIVRSPPKLLCTSTPTVQPPCAFASTREDVPIPPFQPNATVPVPAPMLPSPTAPPRASASAART